MSNPYQYHYGTQFGVIISDTSDPHYYVGHCYHSFRDWGLYPNEKPVIAPPTPKTQTVDIPGADGELDFTESLTGDAKYKNRVGEFKFVFLGDRRQWDATYHEILNAIHGKRLAVKLDEDNRGFYYGRITVEEPTYKNRRFYLTIAANLEPYRYDMQTSDEDWIWDDFEFATDTIRGYTYTLNNEVKIVQVAGSLRSVSPVITLGSGGSMNVSYLNYLGVSQTRALVVGDNVFGDLIIRDETAALAFSGTGDVAIKFRGGVL